MYNLYYNFIHILFVFSLRFKLFAGAFAPLKGLMYCSVSGSRGGWHGNEMHMHCTQQHLLCNKLAEPLITLDDCQQMNHRKFILISLKNFFKSKKRFPSNMKKGRGQTYFFSITFIAPHLCLILSVKGVKAPQKVLRHQLKGKT